MTLLTLKQMAFASPMNRKEIYDSDKVTTVLTIVFLGEEKKPKNLKISFFL